MLEKRLTTTLRTEILKKLNSKATFHLLFQPSLLSLYKAKGLDKKQKLVPLYSWGHLL